MEKKREDQEVLERIEDPGKLKTYHLEFNEGLQLLVE